MTMPDSTDPERVHHDQSAQDRRDLAWYVRIGLSILAGAFCVELIRHVSSSTPAVSEFRSKEGGFTVLSPVALKESLQAMESPALGHLVGHLFSGRHGSVEYTVAYIDYPEQVVAETDPQTVLDNSRTGTVANVNGRLVLEKIVSLGEFPGREIVFDAKRGDGREVTAFARIFLVNRRLYEVMIVAPKGVVSSSEMVAYLDSFKRIAP